jgi:pimeloyl-ACP methyl ester carboxylesterase
MVDSDTAFRSLDGTELFGTITSAGPMPTGLAVLVHGSGVTREEGGFFTRLAGGLAAVGIASLRFDLRAHGVSGGREVDLTIAAVANDIRAACDHVRAVTGWSEAVDVISASFSGGATALYAGHQPQDVRRLVLLNPRLDYRERYTTSRPGWSDDYLSAKAAKVWDLPAVLAAVRAPVLMVHGTADTFVPVESSRRFRPMLGGPAELVELDGAQHGFAVHEDPRYLDPQTQAWQREVISRVSEFLAS